MVALKSVTADISSYAVGLQMVAVPRTWRLDTSLRRLFAGDTSRTGDSLKVRWRSASIAASRDLRQRKTMRLGDTPQWMRIVKIEGVSTLLFDYSSAAVPRTTPGAVLNYQYREKNSFINASNAFLRSYNRR